MNALTADAWGGRSKDDEQVKLRTNMTHSGFSVEVLAKSKYDQSYVAEVILKLVGVLLIPLGGLVLFLPEIVDGTAYVATQLALLSAFVFVGVAVHRKANKGFRRKIYVDSVRDEVRTGTVNLAGDFHEVAAYPMSKIESFFIVRSKNVGTPARLKMRLKTGAQTIGLVEGSEATCVKILERISVIMNPPKSNQRSFITKKTGAFIRMTFG
jgi:hypothetical protein